MIELKVLGVFLLYLTIAILVTRTFVRAVSSKSAKWRTGLVGAAVFFLIPTWDAIAGYAYFRYLCTTEGGARVHKTVELGSEYWKPDGSLIITETGPKYKPIRTLGSRYSISVDARDPIASRPFRISTTKYSITDILTGEVVGTYTYFTNFGGWLINNTGLHVSGTSCPDDQGFFERFLKQVFLRANLS